MAALDFPSSPTIGQVFTGGDRSWVWDGVQWDSYSAYSFPVLSGRNVVVNGGFDIAQRGSGPFTSSIGYNIDQWVQYASGSTVSVSRVLVVPGTVPGSEPAQHLRAVVSAGAGAGDYVQITQYIENVRVLAGRKVTVSFQAKADTAKSIAIDLAQFAGSAYVTVPFGKVAVTTAWQKYSLTGTLGSLLGTTIGATNLLALHIWFDAGSNANTATSSLGHQSGTFDITEVQVEAGPVATPFEYKPMMQHWSECLRFLVANASGMGTVPGIGRAVIFGIVPYGMRTTPGANLNAPGIGNAESGAVLLAPPQTCFVSGTSVWCGNYNSITPGTWIGGSFSLSSEYPP